MSPQAIQWEERPATDELTIVLRASGERTAAACEHLLKEVAPGLEIRKVGGSGFIQTLRDCLEVGVAANRSWTLAVDADLLAAEGSVSYLLQFAKQQSEQTLFVQGWQLDGLFGCRRPGGLRLYRTQWLPKALRVLEDIPEDAQRPECRLIYRMQELGHDYLLAPPPAICLHDYEQYFRDIYRKAYLHANKHRDCIYLMMARWRKLAANDADARVALRGAWAGLRATERVGINRSDRFEGVDRVLEELELSEKADFFPYPSSQHIRFMIDQHTAHPGTTLLQRKAGDEMLHNGVPDKIREVVDALGWWRALPWILGSRLKRLGNGLMERMERSAVTSDDRF